jgi:hypothetical protein
MLLKLISSDVLIAKSVEMVLKISRSVLVLDFPSVSRLIQKQYYFPVFEALEENYMR